jgi:hypothetical protein
VKEAANVSGENKNDNALESQPEFSAMEAALAELRPRREARFADELKGRMKAALAGDSTASPSKSRTTTIKVPLTQYIRIAQFNAAAGGLLAGLFLGALLGGAGVFFAMSRFAFPPQQPVPASYAAASPFARRLLEADASLTPLERALLRELSPETSGDNK